MTRSGALRAVKAAWLISAAAIISAGAIGAGATAFMRAHRIGGWLVTAHLPVLGRQAVPAAEAGAGFIAAAAAVAIVLGCYAARGARQRKRWRDNGPAVLRGDTAARVSYDAETIRIARELVATVKHDVQTNTRDIEMLRGHLRGIHGVLADAYEGAGQQMPEVVPLEEPPTAWVPRVIEGGGMDEAG
jgi:hypothetical protein